MKKSKVSIVKCADYSYGNVKNAVRSTFELLGLKTIIKPGMKVLLKLNLLAALKPEKGVTTHPSVVKAVAEEVRLLGAAPYLGDSPGGVGTIYDKVLKEAGMTGIGVPSVNFDEKGMRKFSNPKGMIDPILISNVVLGFDLIINIPKLKTHELTQISVGIKNMFGCVTGLNKVNYHMVSNKADDFSSSLVDLFEKIRPAFTIVDAVIGMEGQGPTNGSLRDIGLLITSTDTVAVDAVCSKIMGFEPLDIHTTRIAYERGIGEGRFEFIETAGDKLEAIKGFKHPSSKLSILNRMPFPLNKLIKPLIDRLKVIPSINRQKCEKCMMCVNSCPAKAIDGKSFKIDGEKCIMCFCCRELCKYDAVDLKKSFLLNLVQKIKA